MLRRKVAKNGSKRLVPLGVEPRTLALLAPRSNRLSYGTFSRLGCVDGHQVCSTVCSHTEASLESKCVSANLFPAHHARKTWDQWSCCSSGCLAAQHERGERQRVAILLSSARVKFSPNHLDTRTISRSIVVSIRACHARDPGSIPGAGALFCNFFFLDVIEYRKLHILLQRFLCT